MAESTAPAAKAVVLSVTADSAAPSADTAMLPNVDAMLNLMAESKTPIERCFHSAYPKGKSATEKRTIATEKRTIRRMNKKYKSYITVLGECVKVLIEYWEGDKNGKWKKATQLSKIGDIKPYATKWAPQKEIPNSIVVRFSDTNLLGSIQECCVKRDIGCYLNSSNQNKCGVMVKQRTGILFQSKGDKGWVRGEYSNGQQHWYRPSQLTDASNYAEQNTRCRAPPIKYKPGDGHMENCPPEQTLERLNQEDVASKTFKHVYQNILGKLDDNNPNSHEVAIDSVLQDLLSEEKSVGDLDLFKGLAHTSLIYDILSGNVSARLIPQWDQVILLEEQNAKKLGGEREGGGEGVDRGSNDEEGGREEVGNFNESGISKYMIDIQNRVLEISNAKKTQRTKPMQTLKPAKKCKRCKKRQARRRGGLCRKCFKEAGVTLEKKCWSCLVRPPRQIGGKCKSCSSRKDDRKCLECKERPRRYADNLCYGCHRLKTTDRH